MLSYMLVDRIPDEPFIQTVIRQPLFVAVVLYSYHYFVRNCGPAWMAGRKAFELRGLMLLYNAVQVAVNFGLLIYCFYTIHNQQRSYLECIESDANTRLGLLLYVLNKYMDLLDTIIFVLRRKQNQVTFLHVHHHCAIIMWTTWTLYYPGRTDGGGTIVMAMNEFVHVLMYSYYFVTIYDPNLRARLAPMKKHVTQVQLIQFVLMILHFGRDVLGYCPQLVWGLSLCGLLQNAFFLYLFGTMYVDSYLRPKKSAEAKSM